MGDKAPPNSAWLADDDFRLLKAMEAGQSLKELAKGAVQFSRKFSLKELRQRWNAVLFDPHVSAEASADMVKLQQINNSSSCGGSNKNKGVCQKRNVKSVQEIYYSFCKRIRKEPVQEAYADPDDCNTKHVNTGQCNIFPDSNLENADSDNYLESFLLDFTNETIFEMDADEKDLDKSCYDAQSTLLLNSANGAYQDSVPDTTKVDRSATSDPYLAEPSGACAETNSESQILSSVPAYDPRYPEWREGFICCTLNMEDPEIPCNDDALLPSKICQSSKSSVAPRKISEPNILPSSSVNDHRGNLKAGEIVSDQWQRDLEEMENYLMPSTMKVPSDKQQVSERGSAQLKKEVESYLKSSTVKDHSSKQNVSGRTEDLQTQEEKNLLSSSVKDCSAKQKVSEIGLHQKQREMKSNLISSSVNDPSFQQNVSERGLDQMHREVKSSRPFLVPTQVMSSETSQSGKQKISGIGLDPMQIKLESSGPSHVGINDHIPHFSDVEAMILDMDLIPGDQDLSTCEEVLNYQREDNMKAIIRLEQAANASMKRDIASHGAFASFRGHHLKYYIKKPQVSLGRSIEGFDVDVDIDLRREGEVKKISRLQATINLQKDGSFYLGNLGKHVIYVNGDEVVPGKSLKLRSSCLIEIQELAFIFDVNHTRVKAYLESIS